MNQFLLSLLLILSLSVSSQTIHFTGSLMDSDGKFIELFFRDDIGREHSLGFAPVDDHGNFYLRAEIPNEGEYSWRLKGKSTAIYLTPGDKLHLTQDGSQFDKTYEYSGTKPAPSNYLAQYHLRFMNMDRIQSFMPMLMERAIPSLEPEAFLNYVDSLIAVQLAFLHKWESDLPIRFYERETAKYLYGFTHIKLKYYDTRKFYTEPHDTDEPVSVPDDYYRFLEDLHFNRDDLTDLPEYMHAAYDKLISFNLHAHGFDQPSDSIQLMQMYDNAAIVAEGATVDQLRFTTIRYLLSDQDASKLTEMVNRFMSSDAERSLKVIIRSLFDDAIVLSKGRPAPDFYLKNEKNEEVSLSGLKDNILYLYFWSNNCFRCKLDFSHVDDIKKQMEGRDILFLSISIDDSEDAWRTGLENHQLPGIHLWVKGIQDSLLQDYMVESIPRYMIIDREGLIYDAHPPRPGSGRLAEVLLQALGD